MTDASASPTPAAPRWRPLERNERRVIGVLAEKAKTTPDNYPMTLNALVNGCNQKSNRFPQMQLDEGQVATALDSLRHMGAAALIQGDGRAERYRHLLYEWLGVDKAELAVMTELLLRGAQTVGELRGRAARMEPIRDLSDLQPIVDSLRQKGLLLYLSPQGRGAMVTHNLYQPQELAKVRAECAGHADRGDESAFASGARSSPVTVPASPDQKLARVADRNTSSSAAPHSAALATEPAEPQGLGQYRSDLAALKAELSELRERSEAALADMRRDLDDLRRQLGA